MCRQVVGSNGLLAGLVPLFIGSLLADYGSMPLPLLQMLLAVFAIALHIAVAIVQVMPSTKKLEIPIALLHLLHFSQVSGKRQIRSWGQHGQHLLVRSNGVHNA